MSNPALPTNGEFAANGRMIFWDPSQKTVTSVADGVVVFADRDWFDTSVGRGTHRAPAYFSAGPDVRIQTPRGSVESGNGYIGDGDPQGTMRVFTLPNGGADVILDKPAQG